MRVVRIRVLGIVLDPAVGLVVLLIRIQPDRKRAALRAVLRQQRQLKPPSVLEVFDPRPRLDEAARLAEAAGLKVVMNRCPKIELFRPFWKPRLNQAI